MRGDAELRPRRIYGALGPAARPAPLWMWASIYPGHPLSTVRKTVVSALACDFGIEPLYSLDFADPQARP
jgi:hypothetical protein